jgi:transposase-like protein
MLLGWYCQGMKRKSLLPTPADLTLDEIQSRFGTDEKARRYLEEIRWPNGVVCSHCKNSDQKKIWEIKANEASKIRAGLYQCAECKKQFTVTVGTIFEDSHIPLRKWLVAWYLLCSSKKGISSLQIQRMLGLGSYRTALFMMHRIRYALKQPAFTTMLKGTVEVDETYIGGKAKGKGGGFKGNKTAVVSLVERGGTKRSFVMERVTGPSLRNAIMEHVQDGSVVCTDDSHSYRALPKIFKHKSVKHMAHEYARKEGEFTVHTNTVESSFSLLKRGIIGTFHQVSKKHLPLYLAEFDHRFNNRQVTDGERTVGAIKLAEGKRLTLKPLKRGAGH